MVIFTYFPSSQSLSSHRNRQRSQKSLDILSTCARNCCLVQGFYFPEQIGKDIWSHRWMLILINSNHSFSQACTRDSKETGERTSPIEESFFPPTATNRTNSKSLFIHQKGSPQPKNTLLLVCPETFGSGTAGEDLLWFSRSCSVFVPFRLAIFLVGKGRFW